MAALAEATGFSRHTHTRTTGKDRCPWCGQPIARGKFVEIQRKIAAQERAAHAASEKKLKAEMAERQRRAKAEIEREKRLRKEAEKRNLAEIRTLKNQQERDVQNRLRAQRRADEARWQRRLDALQKQADKKTSTELGEDAEIDLLNALKSEFRGDHIEPVPKGIAGADIVHHVMDQGKPCGTIVYDSKNRSKWSYGYVTKLREDRDHRHKADHAILSTTVFPPRTQQLHVRDGILIAHPARIIPLVTILRGHVIKVHRLRLPQDTKAEKTALLYQFVMSDRCEELFRKIKTGMTGMDQLDQKEQTAHAKAWKQRRELIRSVNNALNSITDELYAMV